MVAQLGCDRGLHRHVPLRVQSVAFVGVVNVLVDTAMYTILSMLPPEKAGLFD